MNAADLARLELAKRAYQAARPTEAEVQIAVRRARLAHGLPRRRRAWFGKGLVFVVLAMGGLAYAKPRALAELVAQLRQHDETPAASPGARSSGAATPRSTPSAATPIQRAFNVDSAAGEAAAVPRGSLASPAATANDPSTAEARITNAPEAGQPRPLSPAARTASAAGARTPTRASVDPAGPASSSVSDWGRVAEALARGDEAAALANLSELAQSGDQRTRDKADLGRAQLLMAHGNRDQACALARALTNRGAGSRIERQAQALLKSCSR